jgi:hypothetical protein
VGWHPECEPVASGSVGASGDRLLHSSRLSRFFQTPRGFRRSHRLIGLVPPGLCRGRVRSGATVLAAFPRCASSLFSVHGVPHGRPALRAGATAVAVPCVGARRRAPSAGPGGGCRSQSWVTRPEHGAEAGPLLPPDHGSQRSGRKPRIRMPACEGTQWLARLSRRGIGESPRPGNGSRALAVLRARFGVSLACLRRRR